MGQQDNRHSQDSDLRQRAETALRLSRQDIANMSTATAQQLVYELQVHQVELDLQNDELQRVQQDLVATLAQIESSRDDLRIIP